MGTPTRTSALVAGGVLVTTLVVIVAVGVGSVAVSPVDTLRVLVDRLTPLDVLATDGASRIADSIIWNIRLPRVLVAAGAGAALGLAGVTLQGLYRNPAADPQLVGLSATGSIGVLIGLWLGWSIAGPIGGVIGGAIAGGLGSLAIRALAGATAGDPSRFVLTGVGFGVAVSALVAAAAVAIHDPRIPDVPFWFVGGLGAATWGTAGWVLGIALVSLVAVLPYATRLDMFSLGMASARHLGVDVDRVTVVTLGAIGICVGAAVGAAGVVAFVGLIAGHLAVRLFGSHHERSLIAAFVVGAIFLVAADAVGRVVGGRFEIPVGLVTALVGGPFLMWLIARPRGTS